MSQSWFLGGNSSESEHKEMVNCDKISNKNTSSKMKLERWSNGFHGLLKSKCMYMHIYINIHQLQHDTRMMIKQDAAIVVQWDIGLLSTIHINSFFSRHSYTEPIYNLDCTKTFPKSWIADVNFQLSPGKSTSIKGCLMNLHGISRLSHTFSVSFHLG